jgi:hypothetical protein
MPDDERRDGRSKNARAQAKHREKVKLYIRNVRILRSLPSFYPFLKYLENSPFFQLKLTNAKLTALTGLSDEQIEALPLPPPTNPAGPSRALALEVENQELRTENAMLRRQLALQHSFYGGPGPSQLPELVTRPPGHSPPISPSSISEGSYPSPVYKSMVPEVDDPRETRVNLLFLIRKKRKINISSRADLTSLGPLPRYKIHRAPLRGRSIFSHPQRIRDKVQVIRGGSLYKGKIFQ